MIVRPVLLATDDQRFRRMHAVLAYYYQTQHQDINISLPSVPVCLDALQAAADCSTVRPSAGSQITSLHTSISPSHLAFTASFYCEIRGIGGWVFVYHDMSAWHVRARIQLGRLIDRRKLTDRHRPGGVGMWSVQATGVVVHLNAPGTSLPALSLRKEPSRRNVDIVVE